MVVLKFGGTSVRDAEWIGRALDIAAARLDEAPVVVSSAMGKTTDHLVAAGEAARRGVSEEVDKIRSAIGASHRDALEAVTRTLPDTRRRRWRTRLDECLDELEVLLRGILLLRDVSPRSSDALLSFGERLSTIVIAAAAEERDVPTTLLDSRQLVHTDDEYGSARPDFAETRSSIIAAVSPTPGRLYIAQGFLGSTGDGITTTLGRGGSDFSATIFGASLGADRVEIWTDVDGIMTADPRLIAQARTIPEVSYGEAAELAYFGARVIHPATMVPAVEREIPLLVCNTADPTGPQTRIVARPETTGLRAVAGRTGVTIITLHSSRMLNAWGFLSRMFRVFESHRVSVDLIATSEVSVSVSVDVPTPPAAMIGELEELGRVTIDSDKAVVSLVGERLWRDPALIRDVFESVAHAEGPHVEMISLGSSDTNLSLVVPHHMYEPVIRQLHQRFFDFSGV
ncbi:MAG: aspartate kinase [Spirochaetales bacterium]|nr:aspartate kinase [Spirochaetales bacterium]